MKNTDPRYRRSRRNLRAALLRLASGDPAKLTVSAVCDETGIDRATFYRHFETLDDLVADALGDWADQTTEDWEATAAGTGTQLEQSTAIFARYLSHIEANWTLYRWALGPQGSAKTMHAILSRLARGAAAELQKLVPGLSEGERALRAAYIAGGMFGACLHWLASATPSVSSEQLTKQLLRIAVQQLDVEV